MTGVHVLVADVSSGAGPLSGSAGMAARPPGRGEAQHRGGADEAEPGGEHRGRRGRSTTGTLAGGDLQLEPGDGLGRTADQLDGRGAQRGAAGDLDDGLDPAVRTCGHGGQRVGGTEQGDGHRLPGVEPGGPARSPHRPGTPGRRSGAGGTAGPGRPPDGSSWSVRPSGGHRCRGRGRGARRSPPGWAG